jgi:hypothetical protein
MNLRILSLVLAAIFLMSSSAIAKGKGGGKGNKQRGVQKSARK